MFLSLLSLHLELSVLLIPDYIHTFFMDSAQKARTPLRATNESSTVKSRQSNLTTLEKSWERGTQGGVRCIKSTLDLRIDCTSINCLIKTLIFGPLAYFTRKCRNFALQSGYIGHLQLSGAPKQHIRYDAVTLVATSFVYFAYTGLASGCPAAVLVFRLPQSSKYSLSPRTKLSLDSPLAYFSSLPLPFPRPHYNADRRTHRERTGCRPSERRLRGTNS